MRCGTVCAVHCRPGRTSGCGLLTGTPTGGSSWWVWRPGVGMLPATTPPSPSSPFLPPSLVSQGSTIRKRKMYESFLEKVSILGEWMYQSLASRRVVCELIACLLLSPSLPSPPLPSLFHGCLPLQNPLTSGNASLLPMPLSLVSLWTGKK